MASIEAATTEAGAGGSSLGPRAASPVAQTPDRKSRRTFTEDEKREVTRLYAETTTPLSEIRQLFGIGDSSLYRLLQDRGVPPRGRRAGVTRSAPPIPQQPVASSGPARSRTARPAAKGQPARGRRNDTATRTSRRQDTATGSRARPGSSVGRARPSSGRLAPGIPRPKPAPPLPASRVVVKYQVSFVAVRVVTALDMRDAIRQAEAMGATEITEIARADRTPWSAAL